MKKLMLGVAQNLSRGTEHLTITLSSLLLVLGVSYAHDQWFLFWAATFLASLLAIGVVCRQVLK